MSYVMCYAAAVPTTQKDAYVAHARQAADVFKEHGATRVVECWGDMVPPGTMTSFPRAVQAGDDETVVIGWQEWPDKATHDANITAAMNDPRLRDIGDMPFDGKRMIFAGFEVMLDL
ncbi:DUF1428 domain-containing protein [Oceanibium sediminis]|uniref:DUF1428 domain-containing protein n=1 Tax=Oceanibium sediminis TaxID=2026339 RepID=UPI000DD337A7|nr:DUF1428 domain-containing protein [Oceanibium sediminis]